jgi:hypothetical protein
MVVVIGLGVTLGALVVQGVASALGVEAIGWLLARRAVGTRVWNNGLATVVLIMILLAGHFAQMAVWAMVFVAAGEFRESAVAFYHSAVNYTTLATATSSCLRAGDCWGRWKPSVACWRSAERNPAQDEQDRVGDEDTAGDGCEEEHRDQEQNDDLEVIGTVH